MLRVGTDCSGIEAPIQALKNLKVPFRHVFACEKDKFARKSIEANYKPEKMYEDITSRNHKELPDIDLYVCGFPCQSFSKAGKQKGMDDPRGLIINDEIVFCSFGNHGRISINISPTLTTKKHYIQNYKRYLIPKEALILQGFPKSKSFK